MSSRSVPTQTDKVKLSGSSVDHEAGELEVRVVQWPDTGAPSLCCVLPLPSSVALLLLLSSLLLLPLLSVLYDANNALEEWHIVLILACICYPALGQYICLLEQYMSGKYSLYFYLVLKMHVYCVLIIMFLPKCGKYMRFCFCIIPWRLWSAILFISPPPTVIVNYDWGAPITSPTTIITEQHCRHTACKH